MIYVYYNPIYEYNPNDDPNNIEEMVYGMDMLGEFIAVFEDWDALIEYANNYSIEEQVRDNFIHQIIDNKDKPVINVIVNIRLFNTYRRYASLNDTTPIYIANYDKFVERYKNDEIDTKTLNGKIHTKALNGMRYFENFKNRSENIDKILNN